MSQNQAAEPKQPPQSKGVIVRQAFLVNPTTLPDLAVGMTNLHESMIKDKNLKMVLVDGGLAVSATAVDKKTTLKFFIPFNNIKIVALA